MVKLEWYAGLGLSNLSDVTVRQAFIESLLESNRPPGFFVDWTKVRRNVARHANSLAKLSQIRSSRTPWEDLVRLLRETPSVAPVLPMLIAWRSEGWKTLEEDSDGSLRTISLDFSGLHAYTDQEAAELATFCKRAGALRVLQESNDLGAFLLGIETGMDTNARKNRSGDFMEEHVEPHIARASAIHPRWKVFSQKKFAFVKAAGHAVPEGLLDRRFDYAIIGPPKPLSIEVNFYEKEGSKPQEIVDSYIQRSREHREAGWTFVWITDGPCWKGDTPQIRKAFSDLDAVLNLDFCRRGVLDAVLNSSTPSQLADIAQGAPTGAGRPSKLKDLDGY